MRSSLRVIVFGSCLALAGSALASDRDGDPLVYVASDDADMEATIVKARASLAAFDMEFARRAAAGGYDIKFDLDPGAGTEFIWAKVQRRRPDGYVAALGNAPHLKGYSLGQVVRVRRKDVIDWGYREGGVMKGHYTTRALLLRMSKDDAASVREALGW